jgi:hypothetical protein
VTSAIISALLYIRSDLITADEQGGGKFPRKNESNFKNESHKILARIHPCSGFTHALEWITRISLLKRPLMKMSCVDVLFKIMKILQ